MAPSVTFSVDDIPETGFPPLPEDEIFTFEVAAQEVKQGPKGPYSNLKLEVKDHPELSGRIVFEILPLPDPLLLNAMRNTPIASDKKKIADAIGQRCFRTRQALLAMGLPPGKGFDLVKDGEVEKWDGSQLLGKRFQAKAHTEEYQGTHRSRIGTYLPRIS